MSPSRQFGSAIMNLLRVDVSPESPNLGAVDQRPSFFSGGLYAAVVSTADSWERANPFE
jgi:hypothetical protein